MSAKCERCGSTTKNSFRYPELRICMDIECATYQGVAKVMKDANPAGKRMAKTLTLYDVVREGVLQVKCTRCGDDIGTMTREILTTAIRWAMDKGGVMCPTCRWLSCSECGSELKTRGSVLECPLCDEIDRTELVEDYEDDSSFLSSSPNLNRSPKGITSEQMDNLFIHVKRLSFSQLELLEKSIIVSRETI